MVRVYSCNHSESPLFPLRSVASIKIRSADKIDRPASRSKNWKFTTSSLSSFLALEWVDSVLVFCWRPNRMNVKFESIEDHFTWWPFVVTIVCLSLHLFCFYYLISFVSVFGKVFWLFSSFFFLFVSLVWSRVPLQFVAKFYRVRFFDFASSVFSSFFCILFPISSG